jgi:hypothetical protein
MAAAIFSMNRHCILVKTKKGRSAMYFPFTDADACLLLPIFENMRMERWFDRFLRCSLYDYNDLPPDEHELDAHFRTAVHHLPQPLVQIRPTTPEPEDFAKTFEERTRYVFYPRH